MGAACQSCGGMGFTEDADGNRTDCPECVGGKKVEREPALVGAETVLPARTVDDLPPSTATPSGNVTAAVTDQGGFTPPEAIKIPSAVELTEEPKPLGPPTGREDVDFEEVPAAQGGPGGLPGGGTVSGEGSYDDMTVEELQAELDERDLPRSGTKAELIARLEENDAS